MKTTLSSKLWALKCNEKKVKKTGRGRKKRCRRRNKKTNTLKAESVLERKKERKENR